MLTNKSAEETFVEPVSFVSRHSYERFVFISVLCCCSANCGNHSCIIKFRFFFLSVIGALVKYVLCCTTVVFSAGVEMLFLFCVCSGERVNGQH